MTDDISSYIGKRGYTIYKEALSVRDQRYIREELTVAPFIPKCPIKPESFSIFQESQNKFYLPKYFGIENFGIQQNSGVYNKFNVEKFRV